LVNGEIILSGKVRHCTLRNYMSAATKCHTDLGLPSPSSAPIDYVKIVLESVRKYEKVPDSREMIHDSMFEHMHVLYKKYHQRDLDCLVVCLCEWLFLGRYTGCRHEEWCNEKCNEYKRIDDPEWGDRPDAHSLILDDFVFYTERGAPVALTRAMWSRPLCDLPTSIAYVEVCFRKQKNNGNYQKLTYSRMLRSPLLCPVRAAFRIVCRGLQLGAPRTHPAAIYWDCETKRGFASSVARKLTPSFVRLLAKSSTFAPTASPSSNVAPILSASQRRTFSTAPDARIHTSRTDYVGGATPS
jgi:hypothetical protein